MGYMDVSRNIDQLVYADLYLSYSDCHITLEVYLQNGNLLILYLFTKKGEKNLINNYRPISLTCLTAKIMEQTIQEELLNKTQNLINSAQHGFILGRSCDTNLITLTDDIASSLQNDTGIDIIYFDFAKAFDAVNHDLLLYKLKNCYKIDARLLKFIKNYLQNRCVLPLKTFSQTIYPSNPAYLRVQFLGPYYLSFL